MRRVATADEIGALERLAMRHRDWAGGCALPDDIEANDVLAACAAWRESQEKLRLATARAEGAELLAEDRRDNVLESNAALKAERAKVAALEAELSVEVDKRTTLEGHCGVTAEELRDI